MIGSAGRVEKIRDDFREGIGLPTATAEEWITMAVIQLGKAGEHLHTAASMPRKEDFIDFEDGVRSLMAAAAVCLDAVEALERDYLDGGWVSP